MRSTLNARSAVLAGEPKGALFAIKRHGHRLIFGIKLSDPAAQQDGKPTVLLLNPDFSQHPTANWHRIFLWSDDERCISFGTEWVIAPDFKEDHLTDLGDHAANSAVSIGTEGIYLRAAAGDNALATYHNFINAETLDRHERIGKECFHLSSYSIFLTKEDADNGRPPIYRHGG